MTEKSEISSFNSKKKTFCQLQCTESIDSILAPTTTTTKSSTRRGHTPQSIHTNKKVRLKSDLQTEKDLGESAGPKDQATDLTFGELTPEYYGDGSGLSNFHFIAAGSYGTVYNALSNKTGTKVAIKKMIQIFDTFSDASKLLREIKILRLLRGHPNIVQLRDIFYPMVKSPSSSSTNLCLVFPRADTDLFQLLQSPQYFGNHQIKHILRQLLCGLACLHSCGVVHRDLKPANILVNENCDVRICDFGLARSIKIPCSLYAQIKCAASSSTASPLSSSSSSSSVIRDAESQSSNKENICNVNVPDSSSSNTFHPIPTTTQQQQSPSPVVCHALENQSKNQKDIGNGNNGNNYHNSGSKSTIPSATTSTAPNQNSSRDAVTLNLSQIKPFLPELGAFSLTNLSDHVVTRYYRAPEIILLDRTYGTAVDMWSVGVILAELLMMQPPFTRSTRAPFFAGDSCFPLSCDGKEAQYSPTNQLNLIFDVIGTPTSSDLESVDNLLAREYLRNAKVKPRQNLIKKFPQADPLAIDLLSCLLRFHPAQRITALEALNHPYFVDPEDDSNHSIYGSSSFDSFFDSLSDSEKQMRSQSFLKYWKFELELERQQKVDTFGNYIIPSGSDNATIKRICLNFDDENKRVAKEKETLLRLHDKENIDTIRAMIAEEVATYLRNACE